MLYNVSTFLPSAARLETTQWMQRRALTVTALAGASPRCGALGAPEGPLVVVVGDVDLLELALRLHCLHTLLLDVAVGRLPHVVVLHYVLQALPGQEVLRRHAEHNGIRWKAGSKDEGRKANIIIKRKRPRIPTL